MSGYPVLEARNRGLIERFRLVQDHWPLVLLVLVMALVYSLYSLLRHWHFGTGGHDLGIIDQAIWHYSRFEAPATTIKFEPVANLLGDHFHPILVVLAPLYWLFPSPGIPLVVQAVLFAVAIVPIYLFTRRRLGSFPACCFAGAYALFWGVQQAVAYDFHEVAFAVPLTAFAIYFVDSRRWMPFFVCLALLLLVKEDLSILAAFFGIYLFTQREFKQGLVCFLAGALWFVLVIKVFIPVCGGSGGGFTYWKYYGQFGSDLGGVIQGMFRHPLLVLKSLVQPSQKLYTALAIFSPFGLLALLSPLTLLAVPVVLERFLSGNSQLWGMSFHYTAIISPIVVMASADGLYRLSCWLKSWNRGRAVIAISALMLLINVGLLPFFPLWKLTNPGFYSLSASEAAGYEAIGLIPQDASVVAQDGLIAHLSQRQEVYVLRREAPEAEYIVASSSVDPWPNDSYGQIEQYLDAKMENGYCSIFSEDGWTVLRRQPP